MIQQSVWIGDGPIPKEFLERMKAFGLSDCVKVYKLSKVNIK
ncbi:MAG: hypothetical protein NT068_00740 [Candidatus Nomurabacteria bacterium]|nr:hypothetical protein [Candidatus Nomurabacteria bacterium]